MFFTVDELDLSSWGIVEAIDACPPIARGEGEVVISRFKTLQAEELTRIVLADGSEFVGTSVHPVWSVDAQDWVPLADLVAGERLQTRSGEIEIDTVETFAYRQSVYNFEVHTEHVYEIGELGVLVHNGGGAVCPIGKGAKAKVSLKWPKHHPFPKYLGGAADQTLKKIPRNLHYQFHAALDKFKNGKYARSKGAAHFKSFDKMEIIKDLKQFYSTAEGGSFKKYLPDFLEAVKESGF